MMKDIYEEVGEPAALELVAEEAAELAQACLKLSRILRGENPTPVPKVLAAEKVMEEAADVQTALSVLSSAQWYNEDKVIYIQWKKSERWKERLRKRERLGNGQRTGNNLVNKSGGLAKDLVDDCISRAAALDACRNPEDGENAYTYGDDIQRRLIELPPAQSWILTSDRLPKVRQWVLCQCRPGIMDVLRITEDGLWNKNYPYVNYEHGFVVAWRPLPAAVERRVRDRED